MPTPIQIREEITKKIVAALEQDIVPWRKPWTNSPNAGRSANVVSKKPYSGINPLLLELHRIQHGLKSRWYGTFDQWKELGGSVKKRPDDVQAGEWGCRIVFYKPLSKTKKNVETGEEKEERFSVLRTYTVFCVDQVEGKKLDRFRCDADSVSRPEYPDYESAEELIQTTKADIREGGNSAFYVPPKPDGSWPNHTFGDHIEVPHRRQFPCAGNFYETVLHELAHWCEVRLDWNRPENGYAMGELVAEMSACILSAELRIPNGESLENHASYLKNWLAAMKGDSSFIFKASTQASKVADFLLSFVREPEVVVEPELVQAD